MPTYSFINTETNEQFDVTMTIAEREKYLEDNKHVRQILKPAPLCDPTRVGVTTKPNSGFRDVLKEIKGKHRRSSINTF